jgi:hypothetical protein
MHERNNIVLASSGSPERFSSAHIIESFDFLNELSSGLFVRDEGAIPHDKKLFSDVPCWEAHPGVCCTKDADSYDDIMALSLRFRSVFAD